MKGWLNSSMNYIKDSIMYDKASITQNMFVRI